MPRHAIEIKWAFWVILAWLATLAVALWSLTTLFANQQNIELGMAVDCRTRPSPQALACDPRVDGIDCVEGSRGWLKEWHEPIDYACARFGSDPVFVFSTYHDPEWDSKTQMLIADLLAEAGEDP